MKKLVVLSLPKLSLMSHLFEMLAKPILEYGAEIWNHAISPSDNTIIEIIPSTRIIHCKFCKFTLGVATSASNVAVYGELGCLQVCTKVV